jgi:hypothetical protein
VGEGPHAFIKPDGYLQVDLWCYDVNAHAWICCFPGVLPKTISLKVDANGFEVDDSGQPIPFSVSHGWNNLDYIPELKKFISVHNPCTYSMGLLKARRQEWIKDVKPAAAGHPWYFDVGTGRWERRLSQGQMPNLYEWGHVLRYSPHSRAAFYYDTHKRLVFRFDPRANIWTALKPEGPTPPVHSMTSVCYDSKRDRLYLASDKRSPGDAPAERSVVLWSYDIQANKWLDLQPRNAWKGVLSQSMAVMNYDQANDAVVVMEKEKMTVRIYDPKDNAWSDQPVKIDGPASKTQWNSFYDSDLNVHFLHAAGDGQVGKMWAYRYKAIP